MKISWIVILSAFLTERRRWRMMEIGDISLFRQSESSSISHSIKKAVNLSLDILYISFIYLNYYLIKLYPSTQLQVTLSDFFLLFFSYFLSS